MEEINYWAVAVAAIAVFIVGSIWYGIFSKTMPRLNSGATTFEKLPPWMMLAELVRSMVLAIVIAHLVVFTGTTNWVGTLKLAVWLWIGFPLILLLGSVMWEKVPWKLAALHAGDWLLKLMIIAVIIGIWSA